MARTFTRASAEKVTLPIGGLNFIAPFTCVAILKRAADGTTDSVIRIGATDGSANILRLNTSNQIEMGTGLASSHSTTTVVTANGWVLAACTKASGTVIPNFSKYTYSTNAWVHEAGNVTLVNPGTPATNAWLGGSPGNWNGDLAILGVWNVALTDAQVESLAFSLAAWFQVQPKGLWLLDQSATTQKVADLSGNGANESAITGTSVASSSVPVFSYGAPVLSVLRQPAAVGGGANSPRDLLLLGAG
jgi:hypothetical protein